VLPDRNASTLGVLDGRAEFAPGVTASFDLAGEPGVITRILTEVSDGTVRMGTASASFGDIRYIAAPVAVDEGRGVFIIAVDIGAELSQFTGAFAVYAPVAAGMLLIVALVGWLVAGRLLAPIRRLREAAEDITAHERSVRIPANGTDDVSELARTFNGMLDRLDAALVSQRRLLDDVRHELKTPITIVRGHLELMDASDTDDIRATRLIAIDELDRMSGMIDEIELLAESRLVPVRRESVHAGDLTSEIFAKARGIRSRTWQLAASAHSQVSIDRQKVAQAWLQLVDNAVKYSPEGSTILIGSVDHETTVEFWVQNTGAGIPAGQELSIFERNGRAHDGDIPGSGLGLSIVRSIVLAHGGRVGAASTASGTRIGFVLPVQSSSVPTREAVSV
jgi:signal transduction histidine kinase